MGNGEQVKQVKIILFEFLVSVEVYYFEPTMLDVHLLDTSH